MADGVKRLIFDVLYSDKDIIGGSLVSHVDTIRIYIKPVFHLEFRH